ncbi:MAG TPA: cation:dicarboxylase symporter family transporter, partial [Candidatus Hydrogenedentes bacterium]|nr:cation:dicarboxylase symporter family transporter [Candidatus Hydrogenedentota bacterium]
MEHASPSPGTSKLSLCFYTFSAFVLGLGSVWAPVTGMDIVQGLLRAAFIFIMLWFFLNWLPRRTTLPIQVFVAMILGVLAGWLLTKLVGRAFVIEYLGIFGKLFILLLTFVILPLIFVSVLNGTAGIGDPKRLGTVGFKSLLYYFCTTGLAVLLGLFLVNMVRPGEGRKSLRKEVEAQATRERQATGAEDEDNSDKLSLGLRLQNQVLPAVIHNPIMADQNPLVVIFFAILLGCALAALGKDGLPALEVFKSLDKAFITIILWVMRLAPVGVFALMARTISELGIAYMVTLAKYFGTVMLGLGLHFCLLTCV